MYAVKNDKGEWMSLDDTQTGIWYTNNPTLFKDKSYAEAQSIGRKAHVVELIEKPSPVVVSQEEAEMLKQAKRDFFPSTRNISYYLSSYQPLDQKKVIDRLMRAYVIGWTVEKPKQYLVKVKGHFERPTYYALRFNEYLAFGYREQDQQKLSDYPAYPFTEKEIIKYGLENCEKVEVSNKGAKDE